MFADDMFGVYNGEMDTADFLRHIQSLLWYQEQIVHVEQVPSREARTRDLDPPLDARLVQRLEDMGVSGLYTHQAEAVEKLRDGKNVIVATPAASGKSMCYNLPVLERCWKTARRARCTCTRRRRYRRTRKRSSPS